MKQGKCITAVAGLDIGKAWLDVALAESDLHTRFANTKAGISELLIWLEGHGVKRVGMEASGNYERDAREALEAKDFEVIVHQPAQVRAYAHYRRLRAKSDKIDARLIAKATAQWEGLVARRDKDVVELAEVLTFYEQVSGMLAQSRTVAEHQRLEEVCQAQAKMVDYLVRLKQSLMATILRRLRKRADLATRFDLLKSLPGIGQIVAAVLVIRMPELGNLAHGQAASLLGVAPFDRDSGLMKGLRFITGGRARPRTFVYIAALAAKRLNGPFKAFADKLIANGKSPKVPSSPSCESLSKPLTSPLKDRHPGCKPSPDPHGGSPVKLGRNEKPQITLLGDCFIPLICLRFGRNLQPKGRPSCSAKSYSTASPPD